MIKVKTSGGFELEIDERIKNDWRLVEAIADAEDKDASKKIKGTANLISLIVGKDKDRFMEYIASKNDGFIPMEQVNLEIIDIMHEMKIKN